MLNHQTMEKLHALRLTGMADAYRKQMEDTQTAGLSLRNASECWWISTGPGAKTRPWRGG